MKRNVKMVLSFVLVLALIVVMLPAMTFKLFAAPTVKLQNGSYNVTFKYTNNTATSVYVAGDFNSWSTNSNDWKMTKNSSGEWELTKTIDSGVYGYKLVVDGEWKIDPTNNTYYPNSDNSKLVVPGNVQSPVISGDSVTFNFPVEQISGYATSVKIKGSYNGWAEEEMRLSKDGSHYTFTVSGLSADTYEYGINVYTEDGPSYGTFYKDYYNMEAVSLGGNSIFTIQPGENPTEESTEEETTSEEATTEEEITSEDTTSGEDESTSEEVTSGEDESTSEEVTSGEDESTSEEVTSGEEITSEEATSGEDESTSEEVTSGEDEPTSEEATSGEEITSEEATSGEDEPTSEEATSGEDDTTPEDDTTKDDGSVPDVVILEGKDVKYSGTGEYVLRLDREINKFIEVLMDGAVVGPSNYTVTEGSTIITFSESFLKSLSEGEHIVKVNFTDGFAETTLTVRLSSDSAPAEVPPTTANNGAPVKTGDVVPVTLLVILFVSAAVAIVSKKKENN